MQSFNRDGLLLLTGRSNGFVVLLVQMRFIVKFLFYSVKLFTWSNFESVILFILK